MSFSCQNPVDLLGEVLVLGFFVVKELGAFRGIIDDFGNLPIVSCCP